MFGSGAFASVPQDFKPRILDELTQLSQHLAALPQSAPRHADMSQRVQRLIEALQTHASEDFELDFG